MVTNELLTAWGLLSLELFVKTFILYVAIMKMREVKDTIYQVHWSVRWLCYLILFVGLVFNTALNWVLLTVVFFEIPREFLCTARVIRHKKESTGKRQRLAIWFCANWLTPFDKSHCE